MSDFSKFNPLERAIYELEVLTYFVGHMADPNSPKDMERIYNDLLTIDCIGAAMNQMTTEALRYLPDYSSTVKPVLDEWVKVYNEKMMGVFKAMSPELSRKYTEKKAATQAEVILKMLDRGIQDLKVEGEHLGVLKTVSTKKSEPN